MQVFSSYLFHAHIGLLSQHAGNNLMIFLPPTPGTDDLPAPCGQQLDYCKLLLCFNISQVQGRPQEDPVVPCVRAAIVSEHIFIGSECMLQSNSIVCENVRSVSDLGVFALYGNAQGKNCEGLHMCVSSAGKKIQTALLAHLSCNCRHSPAQETRRLCQAPRWANLCNSGLVLTHSWVKIAQTERDQPCWWTGTKDSNETFGNGLADLRCR